MVRQYKYIDVKENQFNYEGKEVFIWGRGNAALQIFKVIQSQKGRVIGFIDSYIDDEEIREYAGRRLFKPDEVKNQSNLIIYVASGNRDSRVQIMEQLRRFNNPVVLCYGTVYGPGEYDIKKSKTIIDEEYEKIRYVLDRLNDEKSKRTMEGLIEYRCTNNSEILSSIYENTHQQYFPPDIMIFNEHEVFVDAGGYDGDSSKEFSKQTNGMYDHIYIMEPDETMYWIAREKIKTWARDRLSAITVLKKGAYSTTRQIGFSDSALSGSSKISADGDEIIDTIAIDDLLEDKKVTFIKMDVEGAEIQALEGAKKAIKRWHPKLAISVYHKETDLWDIPYLLMRSYPNYNYYMRHYTLITTETVLYAV